MKVLTSILKFGQKTTICFFAAIFVIALVGYLGDGSLNAYSSFYVTGGISFHAIFQILALAVCITSINTVLDSDYFFPHLLLLYSVLLRILLILGITTLFIYLFHWFPMDHGPAWISFILTFLIFFIIAFVLTLLLTKKKNNEYAKLLNTYKAKRRN